MKTEMLNAVSVVHIKETASFSECLVDPIDLSFFHKITVTDDDLPLIEKRCRINAKASRLAAERKRRLDAGSNFRSEIKPIELRIKELKSQSPNCKLWMCKPYVGSAVKPDAFECLANCFETMADAIKLVLTVLDKGLGDDLFEDSLSLLAETHCGLRQIVQEVKNGSDEDQKLVHSWLDAIGSTRQVFIEFMRAEDVVDPVGSPDLKERINDAHDYAVSICEKRAIHYAALDEMTLHLENLNNENGEAHDLETIVEVIDGLIAHSTQPSDPELRELLLPILPKLKDRPAPSKNLQLFLRETERYLSSRKCDENTNLPECLSEEVQKVRKLLKGKTMVIVGGEPRPFSKRALQTAFYLKELDWIEIHHHQSIYDFKSRICKPGVAVVLQLIKFSSHSFGDIEQFCVAKGKPFVRIPSGYSPKQVAAQILSQASKRLPLPD